MKKNRHRRHSRKLRSNKRRSSRRRSSLALRMNGLRGLRRNQIVAGLKGMIKPVALGTGGFLAARLLGYGVAKVDAVTSMLDKADPITAPNTKIAANVLGIVATIALGGKIPYVKDNREAIVVGMGLALMDRLLAKTGYAPAMGATYYAAAGIGEYVNSPMNGFGEYVNSPMNGFGEYVNSPMNGLGETYYAAAGTDEIDPSDQGQIDGVMDVMEAAAGVGGDNAVITPAMSRIGRAFGLRQFVSTQTPTDIARGVTAQLPTDLPVTGGPVSPEDLPRSTPDGRGYAGGVFAKNLFSGMAGG
jgi:hypothetical protein